ncbi:LxmA leader domain family RiPP [Nocardiopsis ganjiahuensis]|uniref:LxmA leader domain family RiPP n=1 Tax=Nocardiopsis ganjiahuensis TaxID=239984 RepID=UPI00034BD549|nr:LxmA leader domain family RiPP [Nocardiopsis ganjiahuensis]
MGEKTPFEGVDNYTDPAEITKDQDVEEPEATPASIALSVGSIVATQHWGC